MRNATTCEDFAGAPTLQSGAVKDPSIWTRARLAIFTTLRGWADARRQRQALSEMAQMSDRELRDIGVSRGDVETALYRAASHDAADKLERQTLTRSLARF